MDVSTIADCPQDQWGMVLGGVGDFTLPQLKNYAKKAFHFVD